MSLSLLRDASFWRSLCALDQELADTARGSGCPHCGGVLHAAAYPRKPRGVGRAVLGTAYEQRYSFCCAQCRRRVTPPSVRFFGRKVYLGGVLVLACALAGSLSWSGRRALCAQLGLCPRTLDRWRRYWREVFVATRFWRGARGALRAPVTALPGELLRCFGAPDDPGSLRRCLHFLAPVTVPVVQFG